jgi:cytochrome b subunit of formate dehydrogenase
VKRILLAACAAILGALVVSLNSAFAQSVVSGGGFPAQTDLFNDAVMLARVLPFVVLLGIGFGVWQAKTTCRQRKSAPDSPFVIRHDLGTVIAHWTNGIGLMVGMLTGLIVLRWLPRPDELRSVFELHYIGASLAIFGIVSHLAQNAVTGGMGLLPRSFKDLRDGLSEMVEYTGIFGPDRAVFGIKLPKAIRETLAETFAMFGLKPNSKLGKFLPVEKVFSYTPWMIIIAVLVGTGLIKSFRYLYPIPPTFIAQVSFVHDVFAYASIVMLGLHLAAILLVPRHWPLLGSMLTTRLSRQIVQRWHPAWYKELTAREQGVTAALTTPSAPNPEQAQAVGK